MYMQCEKISVATAGGAGVSTGSTQGDIIFRGKLHAVFIDYHSAPATTDVTVKMTDPATFNLLVVTDNNTDGFYLPRETTCDNAGAALLYASGGEEVSEPMPIMGKITVDVAGSDVLDPAVSVSIFVEQ
jgi:hypothetical protein